MEKIILAIWVFLGSLFGAIHLSNPLPIIAAPTPTVLPTPTLSPGEKAICTFYIQATSHEASKPRGLALTQANSGKTFTVDIGTLLIVFCAEPYSRLSAISPQGIFTNYGTSGTIHLPANATGSYTIYRAGSGTITVYGRPVN